MRSVLTRDDRLTGGGLVHNLERLRFARHYGVRVRVCRPYRAKTKGKVDRPIWYLRDNFLYGRTVVCDADLNAHCAYWNRVQLDFSRPGQPVDNSVCEAFNGSLRRECLTRHWFASLTEAQVVLTSWRDDHNNHRPHTSLGLHPPAVFRGAGVYLPRFRILAK